MTNARVELTLAVGFLTRLRLPPVAYSDAAMSRAIRWYPAIGFAIGATLAILFLCLTTFLPQTIAVLLTVGAGMFLTGALHEDGLADLADGLGGARDKSRALEIMRDSRIGTYGMLVLGMTLAIKITALANLPPITAGIAIVAGHCLGRSTMLWLMDRLPYARQDGAATFMTSGEKASLQPAWVVVLCVFILIAVIANLIAATATALALVALTILLTKHLKERLGGYTGDALGACEQLAEALVPLVFLACL